MYRKFKASRLFDGYRLHEGDPVLITDETGRVLEITEAAVAGGDIEELQGWLVPGFINAHCHLELSHLKNAIPQHTGLVDFVQQIIQRREAGEEEKRAAMQLAVEEMQANGIVAVGDICNTADSLPFKLNSPLRWHNFIELTGFVDAVADKRFEGASLLQKMFLAQVPQQESVLSPHAPYSVSKTLFQLIDAHTSGQLITIHNQECAEEDKLYADKTGGFLSLYHNLGIDIGSFAPTGRSSIQSWLPYFNKGQSILLVHNTFTSQDDLAFANDLRQTNNHNLVFCLCPLANRFIENRLPPVDSLRRHSASIVLGTDSYASNTRLSILEEIRTLVQETGSSVSLEEALVWATSNGARALRMEDELGSFEKGKKPGIVLIDALEAEKLTAASTARRIL